MPRRGLTKLWKDQIVKEQHQISLIRKWQKHLNKKEKKFWINKLNSAAYLPSYFLRIVFFVLR